MGVNAYTKFLTISAAVLAGLFAMFLYLYQMRSLVDDFHFAGAEPSFEQKLCESASGIWETRQDGGGVCRCKQEGTAFDKKNGCMPVEVPVAPKSVGSNVQPATDSIPAGDASTSATGGLGMTPSLVAKATSSLARETLSDTVQVFQSSSPQPITARTVTSALPQAAYTEIPVLRFPPAPSDWKVYASGNFGISLRYPLAWRAREVDAIIVLQSPHGEEVIISWQTAPASQSVHDFVSERNLQLTTGSSSIPVQVVVGDITGLEQDEVWRTAGFSTIVTYVQDETRLFTFYISPVATVPSAQEKETFHQILSTIKFLR